MLKSRAHVVVSGRVQGVAFRMATQMEAERVGVCGWVRNCPTGEVEVLLEGPHKAVEAMITWCHKGPPAARVTHVAVIRTELAETEKHLLQDFRIVY